MLGCACVELTTPFEATSAARWLYTNIAGAVRRVQACCIQFSVVHSATQFNMLVEQAIAKTRPAFTVQANMLV